MKIVINNKELEEHVVDLIQDKKGNFYVIEINTVPGMTSHSNVPKSGSLLGFSYNEVVEKIIDASL